MKKSSLIMAAWLALIHVQNAMAADWQTDLQKALQNGQYTEIDVIAANHPALQGQIAVYLLDQAQINTGSQPDKAVKLLVAATTFVDQIEVADIDSVSRDVNALLSLARNADFRKKDPQAAATLYTSALAISRDPSVIMTNPDLHHSVVADARDFLNKDPQNSDPQLSDEVSLALQIGASSSTFESATNAPVSRPE